MFTRYITWHRCMFGTMVHTGATTRIHFLLTLNATR